MNISEIQELMENKLLNLRNHRAVLVSSGDLAGVLAVDDDINTTQATVTQLQLLDLAKKLVDDTAV